MKEYKVTTLYIPVNIKTRLEFFNGFGVSELMATFAVTSVVTTLAVVLYQFGVLGIGGAVLAVLIAIAATVTATVKDKNNICMVNHVGFIIAFSKAQKSYHYRYWEVWEL